METINLTNQNPVFTISGREEKMSAEILKVTLKEPENSNLELIITDENGFLLYTKALQPEPKHPNAVPESKFPEVGINKRFIFNASINVCINNPEGNAFLVEVHYV